MPAIATERIVFSMRVREQRNETLTILIDSLQIFGQSIENSSSRRRIEEADYSHNNIVSTTRKQGRSTHCELRQFDQ